jgi:FKBP-type peptidyl-prolyl cis-trans isomerase
MKKGGKRMLIVPPHLGYGADGKKPSVPPNATLVIESEIVRVSLLDFLSAVL